MKAKGGHLFAHSISSFPDELATVLVPPDKLTFGFSEHTHAKYSKTLTPAIRYLVLDTLVCWKVKKHVGVMMTLPPSLLTKSAPTLLFPLSHMAWWRFSRLSTLAETWLSHWKQCSNSPWWLTDRLRWTDSCVYIERQKENIGKKKQEENSWKKNLGDSRVIQFKLCVVAYSFF